MKQLTKRVIFLLISMMTIASLNAETIVTVDGLQYTISGAYASVYGVAKATEEIIIPSTINYEGFDYKITSIDDGAFATYWDLYNGNKKQRKGGNDAVKKVTIPNSVKTIGFAAFDGSNIEEINIPEGVTNIGGSAFRRTKLKNIIIPSSVRIIGGKSSNYYLDYYSSYDISIFDGCNNLRTIVYLGDVPPTNWTATSQTYVPNKVIYGNPSYKINSAKVIEMITFSDNSFSYSGNMPTPSWTNKMEEYSVNINMPALNSEVGSYEVVIPAKFSKGEESFTANIPYKYTIEPIKLKVKVNSSSRTYGEPNPNFTISYTGFVNGENESVLTKKPSVTTTANEKSTVGTYPITISGGEAKNYTFEYEQGELTVNKAPLGIQVLDASKVYGSNNPTFTLGYSGLKNEETVPDWTTAPKFTTTATKESGAGTYEVSVTCDPKNYEINSSFAC